MGFVCGVCGYSKNHWGVLSCAYHLSEGYLAFELQCPECDSNDIILIDEGSDPSAGFTFDLGIEIPDETVEMSDIDFHAILREMDEKGVFDFDDDEPSGIP